MMMMMDDDDDDDDDNIINQSINQSISGITASRERGLVHRPRQCHLENGAEHRPDSDEP